MINGGVIAKASSFTFKTQHQSPAKGSLTSVGYALPTYKLLRGRRQLVQVVPLCTLKSARHDYYITGEEINQISSDCFYRVGMFGVGTNEPVLE